MPRELWNTSLNEDDSAFLLTTLLAQRQPFTFVKFGDGDLQIMLGLGARNSCDGEEWSPELSEGLRWAWETLHATPNFYLGDYMSGSFRPGDYMYPDEYAQICTGREINWLHFEALIIHRLSPALLEFYEALVHDERSKVFVGPERLAGAAEMLGARHVLAPLATAHDDVERIVAEVDAAPWDIAALSAGRGAKIVEARIARAGKTVIDAGSAFDPLFVGRTRSQQIDPKVARDYFRHLLLRSRGPDGISPVTSGNWPAHESRPVTRSARAPARRRPRALPFSRWNESTVTKLELDTIRSFLEVNKGYLRGRVLDYGCGDQRYADVVRAAGAEHVPFDRAAFRDANVSRDVGADSLLDEEWLTVLSTQVITVVDDPLEWLKGIRRMLARGGHLVMTYNTNWDEVGDLWRFTKPGMELLLQRAGFKIVLHDRRGSVRLNDFEFPLGYGVVATADTEALRLEDVSAVLVTRGNVDMAPIIASLPFDDIVIWDNSSRGEDLSVYGRYAAIAEAKNDVIYVQDDDCIISHLPDLIAEYRPGLVVANMPVDHLAGKETYDDVVLVGWGALFQRDLPFAAFEEYAARYPLDDLFRRQCDLVFTALTRHRRFDFGFEHLEHAYAEQAMYRQPGNYDELDEALARAREIRDGIGVARARINRLVRRGERARGAAKRRFALRTSAEGPAPLRRYRRGLRPPERLELRGLHPFAQQRDGSIRWEAFAIDWLTRRGDIALHLNPRPQDGVVVLNSCESGVWQEEVVVGRYPFALEADAEVTLRFDVERDGFHVSTQAGELCVFPHRRKPSEIVEVRSSALLQPVERIDS
jgi:SAM-dependent methyltransferase